MTNTQFYFALGVPFFTIVLMYIVGALSNRSAINDVSKRIDDVSKRIDDVSKRIDDLRSDTRAGFSDLGSRMDRIEHRLDIIDTEIRINHDHRLAVLEARVLGRVS